MILKDELNKIGIFKAEVNFHSEVKAMSQLKLIRYNLNNFSTDS